MLSNKIGLSAVGLSAMAAIASIALPSAVAQSSMKLTAKQAALMGVPATVQPAPEEIVGTLVVKLRAPTSDLAQAQRAAHMRSLPAMAGVGIKAIRPMSEDASLVTLETPLPLSEARAVAARLAGDPAVEYAEPDVMMKPFLVPATEPDFATKQWNLLAPTTDYSGAVTVAVGQPTVSKVAPATGGANLPAAWDRSTGAASMVVAIIDTGIVNHPDLNNAGLATPLTYVPGGRFLPGYDFVSPNALGFAAANFVANDVPATRDNNPADPGDNLVAAQRLDPLCNDNTPNQANVNAPSTWHGTHSAGVVAATANNAAGIAGIGWDVKIVPVRALGRCGGAMTDVADAILWAAALPVMTAPVPPVNANKANVILIGAGGRAGVACPATLQSAITAAIAADVVVVAAVGNEGSITGISSPANCDGVIAVTAHVINGENATYSNIGPEGGAGPNPSISAAGGGSPASLGSGQGGIDDPAWDGYSIWSTTPTGAAAPLQPPIYSGRIGTSPAAAQVAGVAALVKSVTPAATPAQVKSAIMTSARPFPEFSSCAPGRTYAGRCGSGMLDAFRAIQAAGPPVIVTAPVGVSVAAGATASFVVDAVGVVSYQWTRAGVDIAGATGPTYTTPALAATDNNVAYAVKMTNTFGTTTSPPATVTVSSGAAANAPSSGGGALPLWQLLLLSALLLASRVRVAYREQ